jgi:hypothetical protein
MSGIGRKDRRKDCIWKTGHRWEDNIEMDFKEMSVIGRYGLNSFD